jgi:hypothetical protein
MDRSIDRFIVDKIVKHLISFFSLEIWHPMSCSFECDECNGVIELIETSIFLSNEPWLLVSYFFPSQQIQIINCVCVRNDIIPISTVEPDFDVFVKEYFSEFLH